ncbi:hypothetical protein [Pelagovum pacificum]|nr:hypothetical protein [Pelagovum pacificum]
MKTVLGIHAPQVRLTRLGAAMIAMLIALPTGLAVALIAALVTPH